MGIAEHFSRVLPTWQLDVFRYMPGFWHLFARPWYHLYSSFAVTCFLPFSHLPPPSCSFSWFSPHPLKQYLLKAPRPVRDVKETAMNKADKRACPRELTFLQLGKGKQTNNKVRNKKSLYYVRKCKMLWKKSRPGERRDLGGKHF